MKLLGFLACFTITAVLSEQCDNLGILLYEDLGCAPQYGEPKSCPIKYSCQGLKPSNKNCYFRGKSYVDREVVEGSLSNPSCDTACFCSLSEPKPEFICAVLDCPEWLGMKIPRGCYRKYSLEYCCSTGRTCPPFDNIEKCVVDGKEYREGERFFPKDSCLDCLCQKGFSGKFEEPFCRRRPCGVQLRRSAEDVQKACAPLYGKKSDVVHCCPDAWICPDGSEIIKGEAKSDNTCKFGDRTLKVGQTFEKVNVGNVVPWRTVGKIVCQCVIPPLAMCTEVN